MPAPIRDAPDPIKASFAFVLIHYALFVAIFILSFMFDGTSATFQTSELDTILSNFRLFSNFTLAVAVPTAAINILGLLACIYWHNRHHFSGLIVSYTVFEAFLCVISFVCGIVLFVFSAFTAIACSALNQACSACNWDSSCCPINQQGYDATCNRFSPILTAVAALCLANGAIALAASITGCISAGSEKKNNSGSTTMTVITYN
eukprot:TRINITY_DN99_c0_g1_i1.p1 TRINITY_DN99_c0_g1~~TRINITY_DN99_c0_g1_i1.p1  ORF type:complete len:205 (-),score=35.79 TRINITY_DN99_c0_g1_i1:25-639(-)